MASSSYHRLKYANRKLLLQNSFEFHLNSEKARLTQFLESHDDILACNYAYRKFSAFFMNQPRSTSSNTPIIGVAQLFECEPNAFRADSYLHFPSSSIECARENASLCWFSLAAPKRHFPFYWLSICWTFSRLPRWESEKEFWCLMCRTWFRYRAYAGTARGGLICN